jgi:lipid-binding SYLF domain-containing protein
MLVKSEKAKSALLQGKFKIGVDASASAGPVGTGRGASGGGEGGDVVSYSRSQGLFAGAVLDGAEIKEDEDSTRALYGKATPLGEILLGHEGMPADNTAKRFVATVRDAFTGAAVSVR